MSYNPVKYWSERDEPTKLNDVDDELASFIDMYVESASSILDVGYGMGRTFSLYPNVPITGIDFVDRYCPEAVKEAQQHGLDFRHIRHDINQDFPFFNNQFSHCLAIKVLLHLKNPSKAIVEMARTSEYVFISDIWNEEEIARHVFLHDYRTLLSDYRIRWWEKAGDHLNIIYSQS